MADAYGGAAGWNTLTGPIPGTTGSYLVALRRDAVPAAATILNRVAGLRTVSAREFTDAVPAHAGAGTAVVFPSLGIAVVEAPPDQLDAVWAAVASADIPEILAYGPERVVYAIETNGQDTVRPLGPPRSGRQADYLRGYRDAVNQLVDSLLTEGGAAMVAPPAIDETQLTWGLQATNVATSQVSGRGIKIAVLDTGLDLEHPDFADRPIVAKSFIEGERVQDGHGHGTHCIGTACGPLNPSRLPRYGVAYETELHVGKVLDNHGNGADRNILAGIEWAMDEGCDIISMSLGASVLPGQGFDTAFELAVQPAVEQGILLVAAAGNDSARPFSIQPVSHPANCPSIMAVAAVDVVLDVAPFSNGAVNVDGAVDIAAPGVDVLSAWPRPILYRRLNGTSMATPHVAGIAALTAEANPDARGRALRELLTKTARTIDLPSEAIGAGLVRAP